jgi:hypothetical protein
MNLELSIARDFSRTPGSRYAKEGDHSGEQFRTEVLCPLVRKAVEAKTELGVDLDGTAGYGTSFLEEAFGGLVREEGIPATVLHKTLRLKSLEEDYLIADIWSYIDDASLPQSRDQ